MALITRYGTTFGQPLLNAGTIIFVSPAASYTVNGNAYSASDDNDGLSPERALRTVTRAIALATANAGDQIYLLPGTHTVTATVAVSKAGLTFRGHTEGFAEGGNMRPQSILTSTGTDDELLNITASNASFLYLTIRGTSAYSAVSWQTTSAIDNTYFYRCHFDLYTPGVSLNTFGVDLTNRKGGQNTTKWEGNTPSNVSNVLLEQCTFEADGAQGPAIAIATGSVIVRNCEFLSTGAWATPFQVATGAINSRLQDSDFSCHGATGTMTCAVYGGTADKARALYIARIYVAATPGADAIRGFGAAEVQAVDCYYAAATDATTINAISRLLS